LVFVLEPCRAPFGFKNPRDLFEGKLDPFAKLLDETLDGRVHDAAERQRRPRSLLERPQIAEQIPLRAFAVILYGRSAQLQRLGRCRMKLLCPTRHAGTKFWWRNRRRQ